MMVAWVPLVLCSWMDVHLVREVPASVMETMEDVEVDMYVSPAPPAPPAPALTAPVAPPASAAPEGTDVREIPASAEAHMAAAELTVDVVLEAPMPSTPSPETPAAPTGIPPSIESMARVKKL